MSLALPSQGNRRRWKWRLLALGFAGVLSCAMLALAELGTRCLFPAVNFQDTDATLLVRTAQAGYQWHPSASGYCFGEYVHIDESGCRDLEYRKPARQTWLILGDSVAFGVGVPAAETFVGRVERALPEVHLRNASVVGMNLDGQLAKAGEMLRQDPSIARVTLFYCLNDLEDVSGEVSTAPRCEAGSVANLALEQSGFGERLRGLLRSRSKLYLLLKGQLTDRSQTYFWCDYARYTDAGGGSILGFDRIEAMARLAEQHGARFDVVLLPYEYQLRAERDDLWAPQEQLAAYLRERGIKYHDARPWFATTEGSRQWFLFGDPMHLSAAGHRQIASGWLRSMRDVESQPQGHLVARPVDEPSTSTK
ncbi:MAG: SGNH/GDSL hydrolase family protein [Pirellulales bacterium]|nr:SGNH/GDSL hydrolase family protein [Pirellulales bacterium]